MMHEIWKAVVGYEGYYEVSSAGRVYSKIKSRVLKGATDKDGYRCVELRGRTKLVHRLVCEAFFGAHPKDLPVRLVPEMGSLN